MLINVDWMCFWGVKKGFASALDVPEFLLQLCSASWMDIVLTFVRQPLMLLLEFKAEDVMSPSVNFLQDRKHGSLWICRASWKQRDSRKRNMLCLRDEMCNSPGLEWAGKVLASSDSIRGFHGEQTYPGFSAILKLSEVLRAHQLKAINSWNAIKAAASLLLALRHPRVWSFEFQKNLNFPHELIKSFRLQPNAWKVI